MDFLTFASVCIIVLPGYVLLYLWTGWIFYKVERVSALTTEICRKFFDMKKYESVRELLTHIDSIVSGGNYNIDTAAEAFENNPILSQILGIASKVAK